MVPLSNRIMDNKLLHSCPAIVHTQCKKAHCQKNSSGWAEQATGVSVGHDGEYTKWSEDATKGTTKGTLIVESKWDLA